MIIFNGKGLLVAIITAIVLALCAGLLHLNFGLSAIAAGLIALYVSVKITNKEEGFFSMPSFFFIPTHVYAILVLIIGIKEFKSTPGFFAKKEKEDVRLQYIEQDLDSLRNNELSGWKEDAKQLKAYMSEVMIHQLKPETISYRLKVNPEHKAVLLLVRYEKFEEFGEENRKDFVSALRSFFRDNPDYAGMDFYIGITDDTLIKTTQNPVKGTTTSTYLAYDKDLVGFYGNEKNTEN